MMMRGAFLAAARGARCFGSAATADRITGVLTDAVRDGPRQRQDGSFYWIERYTVEQADGSSDHCSRFIDNEDEPLLGKAGSRVDFKVKRKGSYADVVPDDDDTVIETTLPCKVLAIEREGPLLSSAGNEWFVDWYTVEAEGVEHRLRKAVFETTAGNLCQVGDEIEFKVKQKGNFPADILGMVRPDGEEELTGTIRAIRRVGPKIAPSGKEYTLEFYTIETKPGITTTASRFVRPDEPALAEEGQKVVATCRHTPQGHTNLLSLSLA